MLISKCLLLSDGEGGGEAGTGLPLRTPQFDSVIASASQTWESMGRQGLFFWGQILFSAIKASFKKCKRQLPVCRAWPVKQLRGRHREGRTVGGPRGLVSGSSRLLTAHSLPGTGLGRPLLSAPNATVSLRVKCFAPTS